jgi:succinylglutamate desuccinylase
MALELRLRRKPTSVRAYPGNPCFIVGSTGYRQGNEGPVSWQALHDAEIDDSMLHVLHSLPAGLLERDASALLTVLAGPTLIHLPGRQPRPLFVSVLLHGDEITGWQTMQQLLRRYHDRELPRALSLFIGNVTAAALGVRRLDTQPDYNRIWPGGGVGSCGEIRLAAQVLAELQTREVFASIDIHNNTGINPHYGCINRLDHGFLHLASWFSRTVVYFTHPRGTQTAAFATLCPSVTLECGKPGTAHGAEHACGYVDACLHLARVPDRPVAAEDIDLYRTVGVVKIPEQVSISFENEEAGICFDPKLDHLNFRELQPGTQIARLAEQSAISLQVLDSEGSDLALKYFCNEEGRLCSRAPFMPAMLTLSERAIRQDCLCYVMERMDLAAAGDE